MTRRGKVYLPPGDLLMPLAGTKHWGPNGENLGVCGIDKPVVPHVQEGDAVRPLTRAECRALARWERKGGRR